MELEWCEPAALTGKIAELTRDLQCLLNRVTSLLLSTHPVLPPSDKVHTTYGLSPHWWLTDPARFSDLTDAITEDWGGKPFVDLRKGWQYILDNYPQVGRLDP